MKKIFAILAAVSALALATWSSAEAYNDNPVPWQYEPNPICGSDLHQEIGGACTPVDAAPVKVGNRVCPNLSHARFNNEFYDWVEDAFGILRYQDTLEFYELADQARTWQRYCVIPLPPLVTPEPAVPNPQPVQFECPAGYTMTQQAELIRCVLPAGQQPTTAPATAPIPSFTG